jgi:hypothetical protein
MNGNFDKIDEVLDIDAKELSKEIVKKTKVELKKPIEGTIENDEKYTRDNLYELMEMGQHAAYEMFEIAKETQKARDFEVVGQLLKAVGDISDKLLDNQQKMKKLKEDDGKTNITNNTTNALFVGSTADLQKFLKNSMKDK